MNTTEFYLNLYRFIKESDPLLYENAIKQYEDWSNSLNLIASENVSPLETQLAAALPTLSDCYSEGYPGHRYYAGCENVDKIEQDTADKLAKVFHMDYAYVQPHSGADANMVAYQAILDTRVTNKYLNDIRGVTNPYTKIKSRANLNRYEFDQLRTLLHRQRLLGLKLDCGGHLTHGSPMNISSQLFEVYSYNVKLNGDFDYDEIRQKALEIKPLILLTGYSAYPGKINFRKMREIADETGSVLMVDMAHFAGLVAASLNSDDPIFDNFRGDYCPTLWADVVTSTTHKTLRGPRGGIVLCKEEFKESVNKGCPLILGGPLQNIIAAKNIMANELTSPEFISYAKQTLLNAKALSKALIDRECKLVHNGTDNHLMILDVKESFNLNGRQAENLLTKYHIICNRNTVPFDEEGPWFTSGIRLGTPALSSRGLKEDDMEKIADIICYILSNARPVDESRIKVKMSEDFNENKVINEVNTLCKKYPLYKDIDIDYIKEHI